MNSNSLGNSGEEFNIEIADSLDETKKINERSIIKSDKNSAGVDKLSNTPSSNHEKNGKNSEGQYVSLSQGTNNSKESVYSESYSKMQKRNETVNLKHGKYDN